MKKILCLILILSLNNAFAGRFIMSNKGYKNDQNITIMIGDNVRILNGPNRGQVGKVMAVMEGGGQGQVKVKLQGQTVEHILFFIDVQVKTRFDD
jgi:transcription antitermination factor NusG